MGSLPLETALLKKAADFLNALDNDTRWDMLTLMHIRGSMTVTEQYTHFQLDQSHASYHLRKLRNAGFVQTTRKQKYIYYCSHYENLEKVGSITNGFLHGVELAYLYDYEGYIQSIIPLFKPLPYKESQKGVQALLASFSQKMKDFALTISEKEKGLLMKAKKEGKIGLVKLKCDMEKSRKEAIRLFMNHNKP